MRVDGKVVKLEVWDTAGQERFSTITANYYRGAAGILLVYDITNRESYEHAREWAERARRVAGDDVSMLLVGNKLDLADGERDVGVAEGKLLADELSEGGASVASLVGGGGLGGSEGNTNAVPFLETSAKVATNVEKAFVAMARQILTRVTATKGGGGFGVPPGGKRGSATLVRGGLQQRRPGKGIKCGGCSA